MAAKKSTKKATKKSAKKATKKTTKKTVKKAAKKSPKVSVKIDATVDDSIKSIAEKCAEKSESSCNKSFKPNGSCIYFLGFIGMAVFNIAVATGFWNGVWGVIKALAWPAILVFKLLAFLA